VADAPEAVVSDAPAFAVDDLRVTLGGAQVLHGLSFALPQGRWTAIVGPNGAGKTTLLKALAQLVPYRGAVRMLGRDARGWRPRERARQLAWLGQNEGAPADLRARDVVMLGRLPHQDWLGAASAADQAQVRAVMEQAQCWAWRDRPLASLSGGERQRVLLARALAVQAPLLLMDEPLGNLDLPHQADWLALVRRHVAAGGTAVTVLHEVGIALHADELLVLGEGRVVHQGPCAAASTHRAVEQVFGDRVAVHAVAGQWAVLPRTGDGR
jgi:iron complex transport system ATP-binding protein